MKLNIGSFNVRTIQSEIRKDQLAIDLERYDIDVLCIQETKIQNGVDVNICGHRLICLPSDCRYYGCGFVVNKKWVQQIHRVWKISDRICMIQLIINKKNRDDDFDSNIGSPTFPGKATLISIINVYAPTSQRSQNYPEEKEFFYNQLNETIKEFKNKTFLFVAGDFNAKIGKYQDGETCLGKFSKGTRNSNGESLIETCEENNLFITNSAFDHPAKHQTTWCGQIKNNTTGQTINIYNQIDYIICQQRHKHLISNARSFAGTLVTSDHRLIKTCVTITIDKVRLWKRKVCNSQETKINITNISNNTECKLKYQHTLDRRLHNVNTLQNNSTQKSVSEQWKCIQIAIRESAEESAGLLKTTNQNKTHDPDLMILSKQQKEIRINIQNTNDERKRASLKNERNKILHSIRKKSIQLKNEELERKIEDINTAKTDHAMFKATRLLNQKAFENPKVADTNGRLATNPDEILDIVSTHFKEKFQDENVNTISQFQGRPRPLNNPIRPEEVRKSFNSLSNNKAPGEDKINPELLKYGTPLLVESITNIFNAIFENHQDVDINAGVLIALQKPGKKKGPPNNLRPITLLNTIRKSLSIITLHRIRHQVEDYLSKSQSGFRPDRSTSDVVWTHRWLAAKSLTEDTTIKISGIDMSAAFDTIDRNEMLDILKTIINEDELRIVRFLLSNTEINTKITGATKTKPFISNVGTPQGDSLSPVLFTIYLENALREVRTIMTNAKSDYENEMPREIAYADDVDFIGMEHADINEIQKILRKHQLKVNIEKTELTSISKNEEEWKKSKKVGSLIGDQEDVERRKQLSSVALNKLHHLWRKGNNIKSKTKIHLYKSLVKSILLYNSNTWALTQTYEEKLNAFHRKQLRRVLNIRYPVKITNKSLYRKCQESPLSLQILESRWNLFGHILRRDKDIPANKALKAYFIPAGKKFRGRPTTTLPTVLNKDLARINHPIQLRTNEDLEKLTFIAQNRQRWQALSAKIKKAAEATQTEYYDAKRL